MHVNGVVIAGQFPPVLFLVVLLYFGFMIKE